jgi:hypothetical protein
MALLLQNIMFDFYNMMNITSLEDFYRQTSNLSTNKLPVRQLWDVLGYRKILVLSLRFSAPKAVVG